MRSIVEFHPNSSARARVITNTTGTSTILDSTLRDGEQAPGVLLTAAEKAHYVRLAQDIGIRYIEVGFPRNLMDAGPCRAACEAAVDGVTLVAMALLSPESVRMVRDVGAHEALLVVPSSASHLECVYGASLDHLQRRLLQGLAECARLGLRANVGLEDAGARDWSVLGPILDLLASTSEDIDCVTIADTRGQLLPTECAELVAMVRGRLAGRGCRLAFHSHDDLGLATANSLAALTGSVAVDSIHATTLGFGERAGNAALEQIVCVLEYKLSVSTGIDCHRLPELARFVESAFLTPIASHAPVVGDKVFMHQSGIHQRGLLIDQTSYQFLSPEAVGRQTTLVLGKHSGKAMRRAVANDAGVDESRVLEIQRRLGEVDKASRAGEFNALLKNLREVGFIGMRRDDLVDALKS